MKTGREVSNREKVRLLLKDFISNSDIQKIVGCGHNRATEIIAEIHAELVACGKRPLAGKVSTEAYLRHVGKTLDSYIQKAKIENELGMAAL